MSLLASFAIGKHYRFLSACVLVGAALSGCGGSSSGDDSAASSVSSAVSSSSVVASSLASSSTSVVASSSVPAVSSVSSSNASAAVSSAVSSSSLSASLSSESSSSTSSSSANLVSQKRGLAYGYHSLNDLAVMQGKVSWWYNWAVTPESAVRDYYEDYDVDFVPMVWNGAFNETALREFLDEHPSAKYLLGFNEPNFAEQANLTPQQAADLWPQLEAIADDYNLKLVAPAVNYSPGNVDIPGTDDDWSPWEYLDAFFEACEGCRVDYIAVHCYMKYAGAFEWFIGEFERYDRPIWVTEWASWDEGGPANVGEQMDYLASTVRWMEANPNVYRYSWFIGRTDGGPSAFPYIDILAGDGQLSPLGGLYTAIPAEDYRHTLPGRIEAEGAHSQINFTHRATADTSGYVDLVAANNATAEFKAHVTQAGNYQLSLRVASAEPHPELRVLLDDAPLVTLNNIQTGGEQVWQTLSANITLSAGNHSLQLEIPTANLAINWLEVSPL